MQHDLDVRVRGEVRDDLAQRELVVQDDALVLEGHEDLEVLDGRVAELEPEELLEVRHLQLVARAQVLAREAADARLVRVRAQHEVDDGPARRAAGAARAPPPGARAAARPAASRAAAAPAAARAAACGAAGPRAARRPRRGGRSARRRAR